MAKGKVEMAAIFSGIANNSKSNKQEKVDTTLSFNFLYNFEVS